MHPVFFVCLFFLIALCYILQYLHSSVNVDINLVHSDGQCYMYCTLAALKMWQVGKYSKIR